MIIPDHAVGFPVLRALSLCTCCRQYPGAAAGRNPRSSHPALSAFPDTAVGSACTSTFSGLARRSLALRPAHSRGHQLWPLPEGFRHFVASMPAPVASGWSDFAGWASHPLESAAFSRRTPIPAVGLASIELIKPTQNRSSTYPRPVPRPVIPSASSLNDHVGLHQQQLRHGQPGPSR